MPNPFRARECHGGWSTRIKISISDVTRDRQKLQRHVLLFPEEAQVPPETNWYQWGAHRTLMYLRCGAGPGRYRIYWQSLSLGGEGALDSAPLTVLPAIARAPQPHRSLLGVWAYRIMAPEGSPQGRQLEARLRAAMTEQLARLGVSRLVLRDPAEIPDARSRGILVSLASMWPGTTVYPTHTKDPATARYDKDGKPIPADQSTEEYLWCPTYAAENSAEVFGVITTRIRDEGWDGFDLDHEGTHPECFCDRCKAAFCQRESVPLERINWPADVLPGGRLRDRWMGFFLWNCGRHVEAVRQAVKVGSPKAILFCYFLCSLYEGQARGPHVSEYRRRLEFERRTGYDPAEFMQYLDYANMANSVYPHGEDTWDYEYGLTWACSRVEATVDNPWRVPLAPCFNFTETAWTDMRYLRWQLKTHLVQGIRGLDLFWLLSFDGRYYEVLAEMARLLSATEDVMWDGSRADAKVKVTALDTVCWRAYEGHRRLLLGLTNRGLEPAMVTLAPAPGYENARDLLTDAPVGGELAIPPLDGVFVVYDML